MLRKVAGAAGSAGMLRCVGPPHLKEALQVGPPAGSVPVHTLRRGGHNSFDMSLSCQILQGARSDCKPVSYNSHKLTVSLPDAAREKPVPHSLPVEARDWIMAHAAVKSRYADQVTAAGLR